MTQIPQIKKANTILVIRNLGNNNVYLNRQLPLFNFIKDNFFAKDLTNNYSSDRASYYNTIDIGSDTPVLSDADPQIDLQKLRELFQSAYPDSYIYLGLDPSNFELESYVQKLRDMQGGYYARWLNDEIINSVQNILYVYILKDTYSYNNSISYFPKELIDHISSFGEILDVSDWLQSVGSFRFNHRISTCFTEGRGSFANMPFSSSSIADKTISNFTMIDPSCHDSFKAAFSEKQIYMTKFKTLLKGSSEPERISKLHNSESFHTGYSLFFLKTKFPLLEIVKDPNNPQSYVFNQKYFYFAATCMAPAKVKKYVKAKAFFSTFLRKIQIFKGTYFYDLPQFKESQKKVYGLHNTYIDSITSIFPEQSSITKYQDIQFNKKLSHENQDYNHSFNNILSVSASSSYEDLKLINERIDTTKKTLDKSKDFLDRAESQLANLTTSIRRNDQQIERYRNYIETYTKENEKFRTQIDNFDNDIKKNQKLFDESKATISNLEPVKDSLVSSFKSNLPSPAESNVPNKFLSSIKKQGIIIEAVLYEDSSGHLVDLSTSSNITLESRINKICNIPQTFKLEKIKFKITKPVAIRVDYGEKGEQCPKVVSGPYYVTVDSSTITLSPLSSNFIFGKKNNTIWIHPHCNSFTIPSQCKDVDSFIDWLLELNARGCLGEASSAIYNAFQAQDPRQVILAAMTWITSANSSDAWGKHWKTFPRLSDVTGLDIETNEREKIDKSLTEPEEILNTIFSNEESTSSFDDEERLFISQYNNPQPPPIVETQPEPEPELNLNTPPPQVNYTRAGVEGYTPYRRS